MLRSLFIGFLILSALTSKDVGVRAGQNFLNISADMLFELFNAAVTCADRQSGELNAESGNHILFIKGTPANSGAIKRLFETDGKDSPIPVWIDKFDNNEFFDSKICKAALNKKMVSIREVYSCCADISPPVCSLIVQAGR